MKVLFVCTGNICRSPVAQLLLEHYSKAEGADLVVSSAGTRALNRQDIHPESRRVLRERGLEVGPFNSQLLTPAIAADCDLLLGMTQEHRAIARQLAPARWKRMFTLNEYTMADSSPQAAGSRALRLLPADRDADIEDPMGKSPQVFDRVAEQIAQSIERLAVQLTQLQRDDREPSHVEHERN